MSSHLRRAPPPLPFAFFSTGLANKNTYACPISSIRSIFSTHITILDLITLIPFGEESRVWSSSFWKSADYGDLHSERVQVMELFILKECGLWNSSFWKSAYYWALHFERVQIMEGFILKEFRLWSLSFWKSADYGALHSERVQTMKLFILKEFRLWSSSFWKGQIMGALHSEIMQIMELFILKECKLWGSSFWNPSTLRQERCFWHKRQGKCLGSRSRRQQEPGGSWIIGNFLICIISAIISRSVQFTAC